MSLPTPFQPVKVLHQYKQQHSQEALLAEYQGYSPPINRKYAIAYYWCPQRAGNILHSFLNTIVWSMIHNRTLLWMYHNTSNQEQDCQVVLSRAPWLPSYLEWQPKLNLRETVAVSNAASTWRQDQDHQVVLYPQIPDVLNSDKSITRNAWSDHPLKTIEYRTYIEQLPSAFQNITFDLFSEGQEFLYGMLYSELFELQRPTASTIMGQYRYHDSDVFSVALHSRHVVGADDGSFVSQEKECLTEMLKGQQHSCRIHIMSDRPRTIDLLSRWLSDEQNCSVVTAIHDTGSGPVQEHGPWAGAGYLEDLDVTAGARHGIIGDPHRSSTALLIDLIVYRRMVYAWESGNITLPGLKVCKLPDKPVSGYDYGPGTPTFRHHSYLEPLAPIRAVRDFLTSSQKQKNGTVLLSFDFHTPTIEEVYTLLNSLIYAIVKDLRVQWNQLPEDSSCQQGGSLTNKILWSEQFNFEVALMQNMSVVELSLDDHTYLPNIAELNESSFVVQPTGTLRYDKSDWFVLLNEDNDAEGRAVIDDLFKHGQDVLYGMLFHEVLSYCPHPPIETNSLPITSLVLHLESRQSQNLEAIQHCIEQVLQESHEKQPSTPSVVEQNHSCHIYILADVPTIDDSILAPLVHPFETERQSLVVRRDDMTCTFSFLHMNFVGTEDYGSNAQLPQWFWNQVEQASEARAGWVRPEQPMSIGILGAGAGLTRERLEYKRHYETWKQGRDPFSIFHFPVCTY